MKNIVYFRKKCIGCEICSAEASYIWEINTLDGKADMLDSEKKKDYYLRILWKDEEEQMKKIEALCSTRAIQLK